MCTCVCARYAVSAWQQVAIRAAQHRPAWLWMQSRELCGSWVSLNNTSAGPWDTTTDCWHYSDRPANRRWQPHQGLSEPSVFRVFILIGENAECFIKDTRYVMWKATKARWLTHIYSAHTWFFRVQTVITYITVTLRPLSAEQSRAKCFLTCHSRRCREL